MLTGAKDKLWLAAGVIAVGLIMLVGYTMVISPQNGRTSAAQSSLNEAKAREQVLRGRLTQLANESANLPKYQAELAAARAALPSDEGMADFLREMQVVSGSTQTTVQSIQVGAVSGVGVVPNSTLPAGKQPAPTTYKVQVTVSVTGTVPALLSFLYQVQEVQPRAVLVTSVVIGASANTTASVGGAGAQNLTITMDAFVAPTAPTAS